VTQEQFDQVQAKLIWNQRHATRNNKKHDYLLRALVSCGLCQHACQGQTRRRYQYYRCTGHYHQVQNGLAVSCPSRLIPAKQLDEVVWQDVCHILTHPEVITQALYRVRTGAWLPQELQARRDNLRRGVRSLDTQLERLTEAYLLAVIELGEYERRRQELEGRKRGLERQERELRIQVDKRIEITDRATSIEAFCQRIQVGLENASFAEKRHIIELLIDRVVVTHEDVEIRYVIPTTPRSERIRFYQLRTDYCRTVHPHPKRGSHLSGSPGDSPRGPTIAEPPSGLLQR
jgi:site-specific DNA recombinase